MGIGITAALLAAGAGAYFVLKSDPKVDVAQSTQPEVTVAIPTKSYPPKAEPTKTTPTASTPTKPETPKVDPPKVTPKPDEKLVLSAATSLPIKYKGADGVALDAAFSPTALVVSTIPKPFSRDAIFEVYDPKTCQRTGSFQVAGKKPFRSMAISPGGTRLAILEGDDESEPEMSVWTIADGKEFRKRWSPPSSKSGTSAEARATQVIWIQFISDDKLLSLTNGGRVAAAPDVYRQSVLPLEMLMASRFVSVVGRYAMSS